MDAKSALKSKNRDVFADLREGETVLGRSIISNGIYWKAMAVILVALVFAFFAPPLAYFFAFISVLMFVYCYIQQTILSMIVTNQRVFIRAGILKIDTVQMRVERIESVEVQKTLVGYALGYGTVIMTGTGSQFAFIPYIENSAELRNVLDEVLYQRDKILQASIAQTAGITQTSPHETQETL